MKIFWLTIFQITIIGLSAVNLQLAEQYRDFEWTVFYDNVWAHYTDTNDPQLGYTTAHPCDWVDSIGTIITGMPYHYGGKDTFAQWNRDYGNNSFGPGAHYAHYRRDSTCSLSWAAGIDCSGFVGRCWEIAEASMDSCGCTYLRTRFNQMTFQQVQPGDAFVSPGHARLCFAREEEDISHQ